MDFEKPEDGGTRQGIIEPSHLVESEADNDDILVHLKKLINQADCSDLEFICKDGVHIHASRIILVGRSVMLDTMLTNGMLETSSSVINLPEVSSTAFLSILEFLYTGNLSDYHPANWKVAFEVISAADFFFLEEVIKITREYLWLQISNRTEELHRAAAMLTVALECKCGDHDKETVLLQLVRLLHQKWMHEDCVYFLFEEALDFIMRHTKPEIEDRLELSLDEYFRFRGVLLWCLFNSSFVPGREVLNFVNQAVPLTTDELYRKGAMDSCSTNFTTWSDKDATQDVIRRFFALHNDYKRAATRFLAHIDWIRIPPRLFMRIIEPLKLVSDSQLLEVFRFHSLHRQMSIVFSNSVEEIASESDDNSVSSDYSLSSG